MSDNTDMTSNTGQMNDEDDTNKSNPQNWEVEEKSDSVDDEMNIDTGMIDEDLDIEEDIL